MHQPLPSAAARGAPAAARLLLACALAVGGCAWLPQRHSSDGLFGLITPYRMEIVQGNVVTQEQAAAVRPGMVREQVRAVLGSPMLTDVFHPQRWDYSFTIRRQGTEPQRMSVVAHFEGDRLARLEAPAELPTEVAFVASITREGAQRQPPTLALTPEQLQALPKPAPLQPKPDTATAPRRSYPPLEPA